MERDTVVMLVARNIEAAMERKGTNPSEVARKAGINPTGVYDILSGKSRSPRLDTLHKIAKKGLEMPLSVLFEEPGVQDLDRDIVEAMENLSLADRRRFLVLARAFVQEATTA
jgi:transcriptional regulator with XRE-family HTH domain